MLHSVRLGAILVNPKRETKIYIGKSAEHIIKNHRIAFLLSVSVLDQLNNSFW
jgi:hypothetical protein